MIKRINLEKIFTNYSTAFFDKSSANILSTEQIYAGFHLTIRQKYILSFVYRNAIQLMEKVLIQHAHEEKWENG